MSPLDTIFGLIMVGLCGAWFLAALIVGLCRAAGKPAPQPEFEASAYNAPTVKPRCAVPFCDDEVLVHKRIGYETWTFCLEHGLPYLGNEVA